MRTRPWVSARQGAMRAGGAPAWRCEWLAHRPAALLPGVLCRCCGATGSLVLAFMPLCACPSTHLPTFSPSLLLSSLRRQHHRLPDCRLHAALRLGLVVCGAGGLHRGQRWVISGHGLGPNGWVRNWVGRCSGGCTDAWGRGRDARLHSPRAPSSSKQADVLGLPAGLAS